MFRFLVFGIVCASFQAFALCSKWGSAKEVGSLSSTYLPEASGAAVSKQFSGRVYFHNDSGNGPYFYISDLKGGGLKEIEVKNFDADDVEDMTVGPCGASQCLFLADIGDNDLEREYVSIAVIEEEKSFGKTVTPKTVLKLKYPDGPHNAEAIVVTSLGDIIVFSKEKKGLASRVYRYAKGCGLTDTFQVWGTVNTSGLIKGDAKVTGASLSKDDSRLILMTYANAIEFQVDLTKPFPKLEAWVPGKTFQEVPLTKLPQAEAVAFLGDESGFLYTTEVEREDAPLMQVSCDK